MSKIIDIVIQCDGHSKDCEKRIFLQGHSAAYQRRAGAERGWTYVNYGSRDYCPVCMKEKAFRKKI